MDINSFQKKIGYFFKDTQLLQSAVTHGSYAYEHNVSSYERIEFLGDAIVDMLVAEALFLNHPEIDEGVMTQVRSRLVCESALAQLARELEIDKVMRLGNGAEKSGDRKKPSILADMFEALVAAIYLDAGFENARDFVVSVYGERIDEAAKKGSVTDYKTRLQEKLQENGRCQIIYKEVSALGPVHHCLFDIQVIVDGKILGSGKAYSKKEAQQEAARDALEKMN